MMGLGLSESPLISSIFNVTIMLEIIAAVRVICMVTHTPVRIL